MIFCGNGFYVAVNALAVTPGKSFIITSEASFSTHQDDRDKKESIHQSLHRLVNQILNDSVNQPHIGSLKITNPVTSSPQVTVNSDAPKSEENAYFSDFST